MISWSRMWAVFSKERKQMLKDPIILAMTIMIPTVQVVIFAFAINTNPKQLPVYLYDFDRTSFSRDWIESMRQTTYFAWKKPPQSYQRALEDLQADRVKFVMIIPPGFYARHEPIEVIADASDGVSVNGALSALQGLEDRDRSSVWRVHARYNPRAITRYTVVPGLIGVILLFSLAMLTAVSIVRERERGTMEILLSTPLRPIELMLGKIIPYIAMGYVQISIVLLVARMLEVPFRGDYVTFYLASFPYIIANVAVGLLISTVARSEIQASMGISFFMLPSILLSGFMFPYVGMPMWAQYLSALLPLHYYVLICRGIMLKGVGWKIVWSSIWPMLVFFVVVLSVAIARFRTTVD